jgi:hypothetical protein
MSLSITSSLKNDKVVAGTAQQVIGDPYFESCPPVVLKDMYGRDVNSIHEIGHNPKYFTNCHDPADVIDTEGGLVRSAWITATQQPVNFGGGSCGTQLGSRGFDTMNLHREMLDAPQYRLFSSLEQGASDFGTEVEIVQRNSQLKNRPFYFVNP